MELIKKHYDDDSKSSLFGFDCTVRLSGRELDLISLALIMFVGTRPITSAEIDKAEAKKLHDELIRY